MIKIEMNQNYCIFWKLKLNQIKKNIKPKWIFELIRFGRLFQFVSNIANLSENKNVSAEENISSIIQIKLLSKYKDRCIFTISCIISNIKIKKIMCDLCLLFLVQLIMLRFKRLWFRCLINDMSWFIYTSLNVGTLKKQIL